MGTASYETMHVEGGRHVKLWTRGVPVDAKAKEQLANTARMPFGGPFLDQAAIDQVSSWISAGAQNN